MYLVFLLLLSVSAVQLQSEKCVTPNKEEGRCVHIQMCHILYDAVNRDSSVEEFIEKSICGGTKFTPKVCCGSSANFTLTEEIGSGSHKNQNDNKTSLLASRKFCGYQHSDDYFRLTNDTSVRINEFPWLAHLLHTHKTSGRKEYKCGASLINRKYVLTAAQCVLDDHLEVTGVRLGEYFLYNQTGCVQEPPYIEECTAEQDYGIEKLIPHPNYNDLARFANDIALIRLNGTVEYSDYIRPICLPQPGAIFADVGDILTGSGWRATSTYYYSNFKKIIFTRVISNEECSRSYRPQVVNTTANQICSIALGNSTAFKCSSDVGGPLMFSHRLQWQQEGVASFGPRLCGNSSVPEVSTRVVNYLEWIKANLEP